MSTIQGLFLEFILTFILTLSVYSAADNGRKYERYHLSIIYGLAMVMCNLVGVSGNFDNTSALYVGHAYVSRLESEADSLRLNVARIILLLLAGRYIYLLCHCLVIAQC
jgi:glycerol uptake facilitator-like aquaporin